MRNHFSKLIFAAILGLALAFTLSCSSGSIDVGSGTLAGNSGTFTDDRDGRVYRWVKIGKQYWMAENLNYEASGSRCYDDIPANCNTYGRLYDWVTAMAFPSDCYSTSCASQIKPKHKGICPSGWHIPSSYDWTTLWDFVGGYDTAGKKLKAKSGWNDYDPCEYDSIYDECDGAMKSGNGTDDYGFSALPGGRGIYNNDGSFHFSAIGNTGFWYYVSEYEENSALSWKMRYFSDDINGDGNSKYILLSIRCLRD